MPDIRLAGTPQDYSSTSAWPTISYTANTGSNRVVVAVVGYEHANSVGITNPQLNLTMGSVPFTQLGFQIIPDSGVAGGGAVGIAYIKEQNIPSGAQTISGSPNPGSSGGGYVVTVYTLENVDQTVPIYNSIIRNTSVAPPNLVSTISATAGGFAIVAGCSGTVATQPFSTTDTTWTERRDYRNTANDFGFFIYDKFYTTNKTENFKVDFSASGLTSSVVATFNAYVSNKIRFDTSANGYTSNIVADGSLNSTITVNVPTNVANGDLMLGVVHVNSANNPGAVTPPSGWTEIANNFNINGNFSVHTWVGYRIANTEPSSYQWGIDTFANDDQAWIFRIVGHNKNSVLDSNTVFFNDFGNIPQNVTSFSTTTSDSMVVYIFGGKQGDAGFLKANGTNVSPINTTQVVYRKTRIASVATGTAVAYEYKPIAGNIGSKTFTAYDTSGAYFSTIAFALKQAPYSTVQAEKLIETGKVKQYRDNFNRADTAYGDIGPDWDIVTGVGGTSGSLRIRNGQFEGSTGSSSSVAIAKVSENIVDFSHDHSAQITAAVVSSVDFVGPAVRVTANGGYILFCDGNTGQRGIRYVNGTTTTFIGTVNIVPASGDILKLTAQGSVITAYKNGIQVDQVSNTAWTTGQPGIYYERQNINAAKGDNFIAEDLNSPTSGVMAKMYDDGTLQAGYFSEKEFIDRIKYHYDGDVWAGKFIETQ